MIKEFSGDYRWLSNFEPAIVSDEHLQYPTVEHAYQAAKTNDLDEKLAVAKSLTPGRAKWAGRKVKMREDWVKYSIMEDLVRQSLTCRSLENF
jgi:predicted NAD-dependent protein-ADP-ribosyltransferase YbiA (DUF1768 family)